MMRAPSTSSGGVGSFAVGRSYRLQETVPNPAKRPGNPPIEERLTDMIVLANRLKTPPQSESDGWCPYFGPRCESAASRFHAVASAGRPRYTHRRHRA